MKKEELEALIKSTVTEAVKPIQEEIETLKKSENDDTAGKGAAGDTGTGEADQMMVLELVMIPAKVI